MTSSTISFKKVLPAERYFRASANEPTINDAELTRIRAAIARAEKAEAELAASESERMEQARLLGKGGSREAALLAELAAMKARAEKAEAEVDRLTETLRIESAASAHALLWAEKAEDDTLRLDWLLKHQVSTQHYGCKFSYYRWHASRTAIDAAMKDDSK